MSTRAAAIPSAISAGSPRAHARATSASIIARSHASSATAGATRPRASTPSNILELQPHIVLGQRPRRGSRAHDVVELGALQLGLERVAGQAVEHLRHPPREVLHAPDAAQAALRVGVEAGLVA